VWVTGLPASGKSTVVRAVADRLAALGVHPAVLESDVLRAIFTPQATYGEDDRDTFYRQLAYVGALLTRHGVPVIFDATANLRRYRDNARGQIPKFLEVYVECPLEVCRARDPKGIYKQGESGRATAVPGLQVPYEAPPNPDVIVRGDHEPADVAAGRIVDAMRARGLL